MAKACCHNCIYSCWDLCQVVQNLRARWPHRPMCANQPETPGLMRPTPIGRVCRNYRLRPATPEGDVKRIPLGGGHYAYVDAADYEWLSRYHWTLFSGGYAARRNENGKWILMHREIMQPPEGMVVDHLDRNKANNCRVNLHVCTPAENQHNRAKRPGTSSQFRGVSYIKRFGKYRAGFQFNGRPMFLGYFDDEVEAARAYDRKAVEYCGPFARVNLPEEWPPERIQEVYKPQVGLKAEGNKVKREEGKDRHARKGRGRRRQTEDRKRKTAREQKARRSAGKKAGKARTTRPARRRTKSGGR